LQILQTPWIEAEKQFRKELAEAAQPDAVGAFVSRQVSDVSMSSIGSRTSVQSSVPLLNNASRAETFRNPDESSI
jgi:hypothetical protein